MGKGFKESLNSDLIDLGNSEKIDPIILAKILSRIIDKLDIFDTYFDELSFRMDSIESKLESIKSKR